MKEKIIYIIRDILGDNFVFNVKKILNFFIAFESYQEEKQLREQREIFNKNSKLFYGSFIKADDICFDVGANVGNIRNKSALIYRTKQFSIRSKRNSVITLPGSFLKAFHPGIAWFNDMEIGITKSVFSDQVQCNLVVF